MSDKVTELLAQVQKGAVEAASDPALWEQMLKLASRFHRYSPYNLMLILYQKPDALQVAGYKAWKQLGRQVRKGEKGISILAPVFAKREDDESEGARSPVFFRVAYVFDITQTEGDELEDLSLDKYLQGLEADDLLAAGYRVAESIGFDVEEERLASVIDETLHGYCDHDHHKIALEQTMSSALKARTLMHELAHAYLHGGDGITVPRGTAELEAESVAYIVSAASGLDAGSYSFPYVAIWSKLDEKAILAQFKQSMQVILDTSNLLLSKLAEPIMA